MQMCLQQLQELLRYGHGVELVAKDTFCCNVGFMYVIEAYNEDKKKGQHL
jgi:hypothetical protein